jgi:hypothetical protein
MRDAGAGLKASPPDQGHEKQNQEKNEHYSRDQGCQASEGQKAQSAGKQGNYQEYESVIKHT